VKRIVRGIGVAGLVVVSSLALAARPAPSIGSAPVDAPVCESGSSGTFSGAAPSDEAGRKAAQKGLDFLQDRTTAWQQAHRCYGCHVQAVTVEALSVGWGHQYNVDRDAFDAIVQGMTVLPGGSRSSHGLRYSHDQASTGSLQAPAKGLGGSAFARYDGLVDARLRDDLLQTARELLPFQRADGAVIDPGGWSNGPVGIGGDVQLTTQAISTWRQAYERTGDDAWLAAAGKGEAFLMKKVRALEPASLDLQSLNYLLMGLLDAGAGQTHGDVDRLAKALLARQSAEGAWSMPNGSQAFATGQSLYVLRKLGLTDRDAAVAKGTSWLTQAQQASGGWSDAGFGKAEAMWGVLGLVSIDVLTVSLDGVTDGQRVEGQIPLTALARDNQGHAVRDVQLFVDDVRVGAACGHSLAATWDTRTLSPGPHVLEVRAVNAKGQAARRRLTVYAGDTFLVDAGSRWDDDGTVLTVRDLADVDRPHKVKLQVFTQAHEGDVSGTLVHDTWQERTSGAVSFWWDGKDSKGAAQPRARYLARFTWVDGSGKARHSLDYTFIHAAPDVQQATFGQVQGRVSFQEGEDAANTVVELVNAEGQVVRSVRTTKQGAYQFRNVDEAKYKVRVTKQTDKGEVAAEADVSAAPAASTRADLDL